MKLRVKDSWVEFHGFRVVRSRQGLGLGIKYKKSSTIGEGRYVCVSECVDIATRMQ